MRHVTPSGAIARGGMLFVAALFVNAAAHPTGAHALVLFIVNGGSAFGAMWSFPGTAA